MNFVGISPAAWALGLLGVGATLFGLHLLRVRLRRQTVDSLLFFRAVGAVQKPRMLLGSPARLGSFLLGLALAAAAWTAFARPELASARASRIVVVDASRSALTESATGPIGAALVERATALASDGLGPRGRVIAFGASGRTLWQAGEPVERIAERSAEPAGAAAGIWTALSDAARTLDAGDEIVLLGGPTEVPERIDGIPVRRDRAIAADGAAALVAARLVERGTRMLDLDVTTGGGKATVRALDGELLVAETTAIAVTGVTARVSLGPLPDTAAELRIEIASTNGARAEARVRIPALRPVRVLVGAGVSPLVRTAVDADTRCLRVDASPADVQVVDAVSAAIAGTPALVIERGVDAIARTPRCTATCPLRLALRDRSGKTLPALATNATPFVRTIWVEDARTGDALVALDVAQDVRQVRVVDALLDNPMQRDVPALILGALHELARTEPIEVDGLRAPAPAGAAEAPSLDARPGAFPLTIALLCAGLLLLLVDSWLHHRGRTA